MKLQPLRIPAGWTVNYNTFCDIEATPESVQADMTFLNQDLLQLKHQRSSNLIDLGWTPEGNYEDGAFHLQVYENDFLGKLIHDLRSKDKTVIVEEIERLCRDISG
ncbi:MAG: hypothetical protein ACKVH8_09225 [Pirellulales bacterium]